MKSLIPEVTITTSATDPSPVPGSVTRQVRAAKAQRKSSK